MYSPPPYHTTTKDIPPIITHCVLKVNLGTMLLDINRCYADDLILDNNPIGWFAENKHVLSRALQNWARANDVKFLNFKATTSVYVPSISMYGAHQLVRFYFCSWWSAGPVIRLVFDTSHPMERPVGG